VSARDAEHPVRHRTDEGTTRPSGIATAGVASPAGANAGSANTGVDSPMVLRTVVFDADTLRRSVTRIAHEIVEHNRGASELVLVGLHTRGVPLAERIAAAVMSFEGTAVPVGTLDIAFHRDDINRRMVVPLGPTAVPDITDRHVVLVDDVLATGRTIRAALDAIVHLGRPRSVQLAVIVDRGHRELPIRADYVGKNLPTKLAEDVRVKLAELDDGDDRVELWAPDRSDGPAPPGPGLPGPDHDAPDEPGPDESGADPR
jgi:pyrimidine operon attenuation protein/uracil phosphoribosyltransferase